MPAAEDRLPCDCHGEDLVPYCPRHTPLPDEALPPGLSVREAVCPDCGSKDIDLSFSDSPLSDGVKCWDCGRVYRLEESAA